MTRRTIARLSAIISIVVTGGFAVSGPAARQQSPAEACKEAVPAGFIPLSAMFWDGPWAFDAGLPAEPPLNALDNSRSQSKNGPLRIRLDDGTEGSLRVEARVCGAAEVCAPIDCGCPLADESYWIDVTNAQGSVVAHMNLWAAYGMFQVIPVDLVDGPGDELLIVRVPAHAAPPIGYDLKIWKIGATRPVVLADGERVAGSMVTEPIACARWRTRLFVDRSAPKPRAIALRTEIGSAGCCRIANEDTTRVAGLRRDRTLQFDTVLGHYVAR